MGTLFALLFFITSLVLIIGLIKPSLLIRLTKKEFTRKQVLLFFGGAMSLFFILTITTADPAEIIEDEGDVVERETKNEIEEDNTRSEITNQEIVEDIKEDEDKTEKTKEETGLSVGESGFLYLEGVNVVAVCKTKEDFKALVNTQVRNDKVGYENMLRSDKCYTASTLDDFGKVLVVEASLGLRKVRFINSESIHYGKEAWTYMENVVKDKPKESNNW